MASAFGHVAVAYALGNTFSLPISGWRLWSLSVVCCLLPDVDVVGFSLGIPYEHPLGHRGFTHSIAFAILIGLLVPRLALSTISYRTSSY